MRADLDFGLFAGRRVRLVRQTEMAECGLATLAMVANFHGLKIDLAVLRQRFQASMQGVGIRSLIGTADALGFTARALKIPLDKLELVQTPAVLHWNMNHYVVLDTIRGGRALIHDPEGNSQWMPLSELAQHFTGIVLELRPAADFAPSDQRVRLRLFQLWNRVSGLKRALAQVLVLSVVLQAFVLVSPYYMQLAIDKALPALDRNLLTVLALGFALFTVLNGAAALLRSLVLLAAGTAFGYGLSVNVARRLFRLPIPWFEHRHVGDILTRFQAINPIRQFLTEGAISSVLDGALAILTLVLMFYYSPLLTVVTLAAFLVYAGARALLFFPQKRAQEEAIKLGGREQSTMIETLRGIVTLRLFNREATRHAYWQTQLTDAANAGLGVGRIAAWQTSANTLILGLETVASTWIAIGLTLQGGFSLGMVFAFMAYKTQFLQRATALIDQAVTFRMLNLHLDRLADIVLEKEDVSFAPSRAVAGRENALRGRIELRGVRYRYSPAERLILDGVDLVIGEGEHIAITGPSGGGKSTLLKIILGLAQPESGEVLIDGIPIAEFGYKNLHEQTGAMLQEDTLFAGSLANNIALFDERPDAERIREAAGWAAIHDDIMAMPMGYETQVGDMGSSLSGGQKQRVILARALYRGPRLLAMDEGTSHLDIAREHAVNAAVARLGITRVIIAHRLETIVSASRIYAMVDGKLNEITEQLSSARDRIQNVDTELLAVRPI